MSKKAEDIYEQIPSLSREELEGLIKRATFLLTTKGRKDSRIDEEAFYDIIDNELSKRLKTKRFLFQKFKRTHTYKNLGTAFELTVDSRRFL